jgi:hypothetical protein
MRHFDHRTFATMFCLGVLSLEPAYGQSHETQEKPLHCAQFHIDDKASTPIVPGFVAQKTGCKTGKAANGFPIPDPKCTPGAINPTLTAKVLQDPAFTTKCVRNDATTEEQKKSVYAAYGIEEPQHNEGQTQVCELDHLVSLEVGGADTLDNIWPQCGPANVELSQRFFKQKDQVEDHLGDFVRHGKTDLGEAQKRIAADWTEFLEAAKEACSRRKCKDAD